MRCVALCSVMSTMALFASASASAAPDYDCNNNGIEDAVDISFGSSSDVNENGIPDECEDDVVAVREPVPPRPPVPPVVVPDDDTCCDDYYACIDACAEAYVGDADFCDETWGEGSAEHAGCMALADRNHESCLEECGERPPGC